MKRTQGMWLWAWRNQPDDESIVHFSRTRPMRLPEKRAVTYVILSEQSVWACRKQVAAFTGLRLRPGELRRVRFSCFAALLPQR